MRNIVIRNRDVGTIRSKGYDCFLDSLPSSKIMKHYKTLSGVGRQAAVLMATMAVLGTLSPRAEAGCSITGLPDDFSTSSATSATVNVCGYTFNITSSVLVNQLKSVSSATFVVNGQTVTASVNASSATSFWNQIKSATQASLCVGWKDHCRYDRRFEFWECKGKRYPDGHGQWRDLLSGRRDEPDGAKCS